ncbi:MAG: hypothetical protein Q7T26_11370 [Dehalococcoidia bacterium]|nr:hypothetical protein [Dehalococcoidia bacterium]
MTTATEARVRVRLLPLGGNQSLLVARCTQCERGLIVGPIGSQHIGIVNAGCIDCDNSMDFYVHSGERKAWLMVPLDMDPAKGAKK